MKRAALLLALPMATLLPQAASAQSEDADAAKKAAFDKRIFGGTVGDKASACFVRRYDAGHLAQHPKQKVSAMKLLLTAEKAPDEPAIHMFRIGVQFRNKPGNFDGDSACGYLIDDEGKKETSFSCGAECGGGGFEVAMAKDDKSVIVRVDTIGIYDRKHPDGDLLTLEGGKDDKVFRLDRVDNAECAELLPKPKQTASAQRK
jgi:hypothetical protein